MVAVIATNVDIAEEVELGRTLLAQGHLETAQRVLVKVCQAQPEHAEAFRMLASVLSKRGDERRARPLVDYADELDAQRTNELPSGADDIPPGAQTRRARSGVGQPAEAPMTKEASPFELPDIKAAPAAQRPLTLPQPAPSASAGLPAMTLPRPAPTPPKRGRGWLLVTLILGLGLAAGAVALYQMRGRGKVVRPSPREELDRALASGTLELLMRARDIAKIALESGPFEPDSLVRLGLVNALLTSDYAVEAKKDAEDALDRAQSGPEAGKERRSLASAARALLALADGDRSLANQHVNAAMAASAGEPTAFVLLASGRVRALAGDAAGAARDLDRAMGMSPDLAPVVIDWAASQMEGGNPVTARRALATLLDKSTENSKARLLFADAERALGETDWVKNVELACHSDVKISRIVRSACAVESAAQARLEGERTVAIRKAKAVSQTMDDPYLLGQSSLLLASLGEVDAADEVLARARKAGDPTMPALRWADLAIRLGRAENPQTLPAMDRPAGPERDLTALRLAYARGGGDALAQTLKEIPPGVLDIDWDVRALAALADPTGPTKQELAVLEKRGDKGNPAASYVLGLLAMRDKDFKLVVRRLEKALSLQADTCQAAIQYLDASARVGRTAQPNRGALRGIHARNSKCPIPEP
jgi:Tfp pilus assembly protein PilF